MEVVELISEASEVVTGHQTVWLEYYLKLK
jgi:hypothetical protein